MKRLLTIAAAALTLAGCKTMYMPHRNKNPYEGRIFYTKYLNRTADVAGVQYWSNVWLANGGPEQVQAGIIGSPEYYRTASLLHPNLTSDAAWVTAR